MNKEEKEITENAVTKDSTEINKEEVKWIMRK